MLWFYFCCCRRRPKMVRHAVTPSLEKNVHRNERKERHAPLHFHLVRGNLFHLLSQHSHATGRGRVTGATRRKKETVEGGRRKLGDLECVDTPLRHATLPKVCEGRAGVPSRRARLRQPVRRGRSMPTRPAARRTSGAGWGATWATAGPSS